MPGKWGLTWHPPFYKGLLVKLFDTLKINAADHKMSIYSPASALFMLRTAQNLPHILQVSL